MIAVAALLAAAAVAVGLGYRPASRVPRRLVPLAAAAAGAVLGPVAAVACLLLAAAAVRAVAARDQQRVETAERAGAVEGVAVLASELRAGRSPADALAAAGSVATGAFAEAVTAASRATALGADPVRLLRDRAEVSAAQDALRGLAACLQVCAGSGASLAAATDTVAEALRADEEQRLEVAAELAGPRATAVMLALLPVAGTLLAAGLGARPLHVLLHTPFGGGCLLLGLCLELLGLWWTERLVRGATR